MTSTDLPVSGFAGAVVDGVFAAEAAAGADPHAGARAELGLPDWPYCAPVRSLLVPVVVDLYERGVGLVTDAEIADALGVADGGAAAGELRDAGWLGGLRSPGVWRVTTTPMWGPPGFEELLGHLAVRPGSPVCIAGKSVAFERCWLPVPHVPTIGYPPGMPVPSCLGGFVVHRWRPRAPLASIDGAPAWSADTLLAFMATRPGDFSWADIALWLEDACAEASIAGLVAELAHAERAAWCAAAYLASKGGRPDIAGELLLRAPPGAGPHVFGDDTCPSPYEPEHIREFDIVDNLLPRYWFPQPTSLTDGTTSAASP